MSKTDDGDVTRNLSIGYSSMCNDPKEVPSASVDAHVHAGDTFSVLGDKISAGRGGRIE